MTLSGIMLGARSMEYEAKLITFACSPSVITGDPVASICATVSRTASSKSASRRSGDVVLSSTASINALGRGMLPMGSVGMGLMFDSAARVGRPDAERGEIQSRSAMSRPNGTAWLEATSSVARRHPRQREPFVLRAHR